MGLFNFKKNIEITNNNEIMTSLINKNVKPETKIVVPENYAGLVYFRDYYQFTLFAGEYTIHKDTFYQIVQKNEKKNRNRKKPRFDFNIHYISKANLPMEFTLKKKSSFKQKQEFNIKAVYKIEDEKKFAKEILATCYYTNSRRTFNIVYEWFLDFANKLLNKKLTNNFESKLKEYADKYFKKYGLNIVEISMNGLKSKNSFFDYSQQSNLENQTLITNKTQNPNFTTNIQENNSSKYCPNCQSKVIENSPFCVHCGKKLF